MKVDAAHFWTKVDVGTPGACRLWLGARSKRGGYGCYWSRGGRKRIFAHRVAWILTYGPLPACTSVTLTKRSACVLHSCDNPPCCNPAHLFLGTPADNAADRDAKGRAARGARHGSRLRPERVARGDCNGTRQHPERPLRGAPLEKSAHALSTAGGGVGCCAYSDASTRSAALEGQADRGAGCCY